MFWQKKIKNICKYMFGLVFVLFGFFYFNISFGQDLMEQAFEPAVTYDTIIKPGDTKESVGNTILRETVTVWLNENLGKWCFINGQFVNVDENKCSEMWWDWNIKAIDISARAPLIVRISKFLLRMTIVLSITMIIFISIRYMIEVLEWKDRKSAESKKRLMLVAWWVVLALMSVSIINLLVSIPKSSLKTSDDLSAFEIWCKIWSEIIVGNALREQICFNSTFGHPVETMEYRERDFIKAFSMSLEKMDMPAVWWYRCKICKWVGNNFWEDCKRKRIYNTEMESKCVQDLWWTVIK